MSRRDIFIRIFCAGLLSVWLLPAVWAQQKKAPVDYERRIVEEEHEYLQDEMMGKDMA